MNPETEQELEDMCTCAIDSIHELTQPGMPLPPFAVTSVVEGEGHMIDTDPDVDPTEGIELLYRSLAMLRDEGDLLCCAVACEVSTNPATGQPMDAIQVCVEHCEPAGFRVLLPFEETKDGRQYGQPVRLPAEMRVWEA